MPASGGGPGWQLACARFENGEVRARARDHARARQRRARAQDPRRALHRLGDPRARRARARQARRGRRLHPPLRTSSPRSSTACACRRCSRCAAGRPCCWRQASRSRRRASPSRRRPRPTRSARGWSRRSRAASPGSALVAAGERAPRDRDAARAPSPSSTAAARCACATRCAASCASSARAPRSAVRLRRATPASPALTKRELEIADLVTDRKTNREIAGELFLSDKTVESHLRNIFAKLGVSSRVEVARAVEREREVA